MNNNKPLSSLTANVAGAPGFKNSRIKDIFKFVQIEKNDVYMKIKSEGLQGPTNVCTSWRIKISMNGYDSEMRNDNLDIRLDLT